MGDASSASRHLVVRVGGWEGAVWEVMCAYVYVCTHVPSMLIQILSEFVLQMMNAVEA